MFTGMGSMPQNIQMNFSNNTFQNFDHGYHHGHPGQYADDDEEEKKSPEEIKQIINGITSFKFEEDKKNAINCAICIEQLKTGNQVKKLDCNHSFHGKCINDWLKQKLICPLCKKEVK